MYTNYPWDVKPHITGSEKTDVSIMSQNVSNNFLYLVIIWYLVVPKLLNHLSKVVERCGLSEEMQMVLV